MTLEEKKNYCKNFFEELSEKLKDTHVVVRSCNQDESAYLVPIGTEDQITYYGKPANSFRISDHWNWYANLRKNPDPNYIQCNNVDLGVGCKKRNGPGLASNPWYAWCVAIVLADGEYHTMVGETNNPETDEWCFVEFEDLDSWIRIFKSDLFQK
jgi:hypothetical protein